MPAMTQDAQQRLLDIWADDPVQWALDVLWGPLDDGQVEPDELSLKWWQEEYLRAILTENKITLRVRRQCGKSVVLVIAALWVTFFSRKQVVVVCPMGSQVANFVERVNEFIEHAPILQARFAGKKEQPFIIYRFTNGSTIKFMVAGDKGASVRSASSDVLILDEVDMFTAEAFRAVLPLARNAEKKIWTATTINGHRGKFYEWVHSPSWHDIHVKASLDPDFTEADEKYWRDEMRLTDLEYMHEIECEWADSEEGVYRREDIERALAYGTWSYDQYGVGVPVSRWPTQGPCWLGVDWDKYQGVGPQICVVQLDRTPESPTFLKLRVVWAEEIPPGEFCLGAAVERIKVLNQHFNPQKIYVEPGMGERQIEELQQYGVQHPESGLKEKVVRFHFKASDIQTLDSRTGKLVKKNNKHWMVNTSVYRFNNGQVAITPEDPVLHEQLLDYRAIPKPSGVYTYSDVNEHRLDALNLAIVGFDQELGTDYLTPDLMDYTVGKGRMPQHKVLESPSEPAERITDVAQGYRRGGLSECLSRSRRSTSTILPSRPQQGAYSRSRGTSRR